MAQQFRASPRDVDACVFAASSRRRFIRSIIDAAAATLIAASVVEPARAVVNPATVALVVNTALSVAQLFSGNGNVGELLRLQVEMLRHIESELAAIQQGILEILNRLDQLEQLNGKIPEQVVIELYRAKISALNGRYKEILDTYNSDVANSGIAYARTKNERELEGELLRPMREARDILMTYSSFSLVPIICTAGFVETHAMIMANYRTTRMTQALARYRSWLRTIRDGKETTGLIGAIADIEKQRAAQKESTARTPSYECVGRLEVVSTPGQAPNGCPQGNGIWVSGYYIAKHTRAEFQPAAVPELATSLESMIKTGILPEQALPGVMPLTFETDPPEHRFMSCNSRPVQPQGKPVNWPPQCDGIEAPLTNAAAGSSQMLTQTGLQLMSLYSLKHSAEEGLRFLDTIEKGLKTLKVQ